MPVLDIRESTRNKRLQNIADDIDAGSGPGVFKLYSGTKPAPGTTPSGVLQCSIVLADPCSPAVTSATLTFTNGRTGVRLANDEIAWGRMEDSAGNWVIDGDVTDLAGTGAFKITSTGGFTGAIVTLTSGTFTE
jgi:hypothetical protein